MRRGDNRCKDQACRGTTLSPPNQPLLPTALRAAADRHSFGRKRDGEPFAATTGLKVAADRPLAYASMGQSNASVAGGKRGSPVAKPMRMP